ncbi:MAG: NAD(+) diphosphatase, partial [Muribaculaceae bacterium]|nr:NAD(+) diphosphatase [Muribaculaceae bacterium]
AGEVTAAEAITGEIHEVTMDDGRTVNAVALATAPQPAPGWIAVGLRASYDLLAAEDYDAAGKAFQILHWDAHSRFCPACGTATVRHSPIMKKCPACGNEIYPQISPAVIVLISRGNEILLVHARNFRGTFYGLVAGFVEAGETLEQCVRREVMEETGLSVKNIQYAGNQPWPYPNVMMFGFTAEYESGDIRLQDEELSAGAFYRRDNLPELPRRPSIARRLIDAWLASHD